jgi:hypothetical protein
MSNPSFTPGPWFVRYCDDDYHQSMTVISSDSKWDGKPNIGLFADESDTVAIVYHQLRPTVGVDKDPGFSDNVALLIAAAPDMYAALQACHESMAYMSEYDIPITLPDQVSDALKKARGEI